MSRNLIIFDRWIGVNAKLKGWFLYYEFKATA